MKIIELELSSLCNAKCSDCMRTILDNENRYYLKRNVTEEEIVKWFDPLDMTDTKVKLCGVLGDPMINPDLYEIIFYLLYEKNIRALEMSTNGGTRSVDFWKGIGELSNNSNKRFEVHWSIDGATRNDYRENVVLDRVWNNIRAYHSSGGISMWQFIIFDYNENEIDLARQMAKQNGMKFATRNSWRNVRDNKFKSKKAETIDNDSQEKVFKRAYQLEYENPNIKCRHKLKDEIFIGSNGRLWPCCHLYDEHVKDGHDSITKLLDTVGHNFNSLQHYDISTILNSEWYKTTLEESWQKIHPLNLPRCYYTCGDGGKREVEKIVEA